MMIILDRLREDINTPRPYIYILVLTYNKYTHISTYIYLYTNYVEKDYIIFRLYIEYTVLNGYIDVETRFLALNK